MLSQTRIRRFIDDIFHPSERRFLRAVIGNLRHFIPVLLIEHDVTNPLDHFSADTRSDLTISARSKRYRKLFCRSHDETLTRESFRTGVRNVISSRLQGPLVRR